MLDYYLYKLLGDLIITSYQGSCLFNNNKTLAVVAYTGSSYLFGVVYSTVNTKLYTTWHYSHLFCKHYAESIPMPKNYWQSKLLSKYLCLRKHTVYDVTVFGLLLNYKFLLIDYFYYNSVTLYRTMFIIKVWM